METNQAIENVILLEISLDSLENEYLLLFCKPKDAYKTKRVIGRRRWARLLDVISSPILTCVSFFNRIIAYLFFDRYVMQDLKHITTAHVISRRRRGDVSS